jgi:two-component system, OmpR family, sensor histidine kinase ResE
VLDDILPPFEFTVEFLLLVVAWGSAIEAARPQPGASRFRRVMALGFVVIGIAQFVLGLRVLGDDASTIASLIRGAGYLFILGGLIRPMRPTHQLTVFLPFALLPSEAPLAAAAMAGLCAVRGAMIHARDQRPESFSFASAFVFLGIAEGVHVLEGNGWLVARYSARGLGSFLLLLWLFGRFNSIRIRFATRAIVSLVVGLLFLAAGFNVVISRTLTEETSSRLADASRTRIDRFSELESQAVARADLLTRGFAGALSGALDPQATANTVVSLIDPADFLIVINRQGRVVASVQPVTINGQATARPLSTVRTLPISGSPLVAETLRRNIPTRRIERISFTNAQGRAVNELTVLGAAPITLEENPRRPLGVLVVGYRIDAEEIGVLARDTGAIALLEIGGEFATIRGPDGLESPLEPELRETLGPSSFETEDEATRTFDTQLAGQRYLIVSSPITEDGVTVASLVLATSPDALAGVLEGLTRVLFFLLLIALVVSAGYALRAGKRVTAPLVALTQASLALRSGDLSARAEVSGDDEIGTLSAAFNAMAIDLEATTSHLQNSVEAEASLRGRLETIVQSMGDALIAFDSQGLVTTLNKAAERLLGLKGEDVAGSHVAEMVDGRTVDGTQLGTALLSQASGEASLRTGRTQRLISFQSRPLASPNGSAGRVVVIRDETETRQAERMKDEFLANVSHELRTPLTPIRGFADILTRKEVPREKSAEYLRKILESSLRLERIVDILVDFAAIEAGRMAIRSEALPVTVLVKERGRDWEDLEPDRKIRTSVKRDVGKIQGDPSIVVRALDELIDNAIKFSDGPVSISAEREPNSRPAMIRITVSDRGSGIPEDRIADIFRGFQQVNGSETREVGGLGLGLAFVKRAIEHIGGIVEVQSEAGRGTAVSILLPEASEKTKPPARKRRTAVVDGASPVTRRSKSA